MEIVVKIKYHFFSFFGCERSGQSFPLQPTQCACLKIVMLDKRYHRKKSEAFSFRGPSPKRVTVLAVLAINFLYSNVLKVNEGTQNLLRVHPHYIQHKRTPETEWQDVRGRTWTTTSLKTCISNKEEDTKKINEPPLKCRNSETKL